MTFLLHGLGGHTCLGLKHIAKHFSGFDHFVDRADRNPRVALLEGREIAADCYTELRTRVTKVLCSTMDVDEEKVGLRVGGLAAEVLERLHRKRADARVPVTFIFNVQGILKGSD